MSSIPRRHNDFLQEKTSPEASTVAATSATGTVMLQTMDADYVVDKFEVMIPGGYTASDTDYYLITLQAGATVLGTLSLKTTGGGGHGSMTDLVFASATLIAAPNGSSGDALKVVLTKNGSAVDLAAGTRLVAHCHLL